MGCNCGQNKRNIQWEVRFNDGTVTRYETQALAASAVRKARGGQIKPVPVSA